MGTRGHVTETRYAGEVDLADARFLAQALLRKHGLHNWVFAFNRRRRVFGVCDFQKRTIYLSSPLAELNGEAEVRDTLLHEIAHALAGPKAGHGPVWQGVARAVGAKPRRCYSSQEVQQPQGRYQLVCPSCGHAEVRYRRPTRVYACRCCCDRYNNGRYSECYRLKLLHREAG